MRSLLASLGAVALLAVGVPAANADVALVSSRIVAQPEVYGGQTMTAVLDVTCSDAFNYVRVELRQRNKTSTGFAGYVNTYNSIEAVCDGESHRLSVALSDNRFRTGPAELRAERLTPEGTDTTGWVPVKVVKK